jgi:CheY-like chemotaxis protein
VNNANQKWRGSISGIDSKPGTPSVPSFNSVTDSLGAGCEDNPVGEVKRSEGAARTADPRVKQPDPTKFKTVLVVDDQDVCRVTLKWFLANLGYTVVPARSAEEALLLFDPKTHAVVVTDQEMTGLTGTEMAHIIKLRSPATPVIMYASQPPNDTSCVDAVIRKPTHLLTLKEAIDEALAACQPSAETH